MGGSPHGLQQIITPAIGKEGVDEMAFRARFPCSHNVPLFPSIQSVGRIGTKWLRAELIPLGIAVAIVAGVLVGGGVDGAFGPHAGTAAGVGDGFHLDPEFVVLVVEAVENVVGAGWLTFLKLGEEFGFARRGGCLEGAGEVARQRGERWLGVSAEEISLNGCEDVLGLGGCVPFLCCCGKVGRGGGGAEEEDGEFGRHPLDFYLGD